MAIYRLLASTPFEYDDGSEFHDVTYPRDEREFEASDDEEAIKVVEHEASQEVYVLGKRRKLNPISLTKVVKTW